MFTPISSVLHGFKPEIRVALSYTWQAQNIHGAKISFTLQRAISECPQAQVHTKSPLQNFSSIFYVFSQPNSPSLSCDGFKSTTLKWKSSSRGQGALGSLGGWCCHSMGALWLLLNADPKSIRGNLSSSLSQQRFSSLRPACFQLWV